MEIINYLKKNQISLIILLLSLLLILPKWILSFTFFDENITLRIINDTSDAAYYPLINSFSDFNLSNSYDDNLNNLKLISYPFIGLAINSFFWINIWILFISKRPYGYDVKIRYECI